MAVKRLPEDTRMEIFHAFVQAEDDGNSLDETRTLITQRYGISLEQLRAIEHEGIEKTWPPLEECEDEDEDQV